MNNPLSGTDPTGYVPVIPVIIWTANAYAAYETANETMDAVEDYQNGEISVTDVAATIATSAVENTIGKKAKVAKAGLDKMRQAAKGKAPKANVPDAKSQNTSNTDGGAKTSNGADNTQEERSANQATTDIGSPKEISKAKRRASRQAQRKAGIPTSKSGKNSQNPGGQNQPRHQVKEGADGKPDSAGVVDGRGDHNNGEGHTPHHVEAGELKSPATNKQGTPRIKNNKGQSNQKVKVEYEDDIKQ